MSPSTSNAASPDYRTGSHQVFFGDDNFKERLLEGQSKPPQKHVQEKAPPAELRKSSSLFTVGTTNKKLFDTKAPTKQKLSIHPSSMTAAVASQKGAASENKMTAISNIGGDLLRSKTADFERLLIGKNHSAEPRTYKRKEIISSAHNSKH